MTKLLELTPMMKQWQECKKASGEALLLFQLGDFYECFFEDAKIVSDILHIAYTKRGDTPMAGIPVGSLDNYLEKLIASGLSVAIAEQGEVSEDGKGIVSRSIKRILSPATFISSKDPNFFSNNFLLAISIINQSHAIAYIDTSTSEFFVSTFSSAFKLEEEILRIKPKEILICRKLFSKNPKFMEEIQKAIATKFIKIDPFYFDHKLSLERLQKILKVGSLDGFGLKGETSAINASGALCCFLENDLFFDTKVIHSIKKRNTDSFVCLDQNTLSHLEIFESKSGYCLFDVLNNTKTAMGSRLLKSAIFYPLKEKSKIISRQNSIKELLNRQIDLSPALCGIKDIERLETKIVSANPSPSDLILLAESLEKIPSILKDLDGALEIYSLKLSPLSISKEILDTIEIENSTYFIKENINAQLDSLKSLEKQANQHLKAYEDRCKETLGIKSLKIGWSRTIGYFIEISKKAANDIPHSFLRKQTLVNGERYITQELKELENKILSAKEQAIEIEHAIFQTLVDKCKQQQKQILNASSLIAKIDFIHSLKILASKNSYICPEIAEDGQIDIEDGSHPILLKSMKEGTFIPNNILLNSITPTAILTGPNMAGKSTYIKSIALLSILTQIGSFIPAKKAKVSIVDRIFTRIGALDDLQRGQSTFMVEMTETANILRNATDKSLIILDEIGRGTSTFDGIALAKSIALYISLDIKAKTVFATHYLELTDLAKLHPQIKNIRSKVLEKEEEVTFLHKIEEGEANKSYGIFVASLAGLPRKVILDAKAYLKELTVEELSFENKKPKRQNIQYNLFTEEQLDPILEEIKSLDINHLSPFEALQKLLQWKKSLV